MATAPKEVSLPLFYKELVPLNSSEHGAWKSRKTDKAKWLTNVHAVPLTVEEFPMAQRHYPIVFSSGDNPVPLALMGLNQGINVFVDEEGSLKDEVYLPAYARRYPFMLAKLRPDSDELSLCFDPTSELLGEFEDGSALFDNDSPTEETNQTLKFCEQFEIAGHKTSNFMEELKKNDLLTEGELNIQLDGMEKPFHYSGFQMVHGDKLREVRGDLLRAWNQNGMLPLIFAHVFSLELARELFARQVRLGKGPISVPQS
ncbi:MAG: SapC family protein [Novosphingobium sp.]|nr:SapC family protein [Novosphingobium sp.]MCP5403104.1 SapC family protein [Novosphingobium sp.]